MGKGTFVNDLVRGDPFASARRQENKMQDAMRSQQAQIESDIAKRKKEEEDAKRTQGENAYRRAAQRSARTNYARGTILTSPIGVVGEGNSGGGKTLLGM